MKTKLIVVVVVAILSGTVSALAASPEIDGDIRIRIQNRGGDTDSPTKGTFTITRVRLNASLPVDKNISVYSRLAIEQAAGKAHNNGLYDTGGAFDRWGINWKHKNGAIKLGRQDVVLGQEGLALTTLIDAVGANNQLTGLTATWKVDDTSLKLVGGRLGDGLFQPLVDVFASLYHRQIDTKIAANLYALQLDHKIDQRFSIGATYRRIATIDQESSVLAKFMLPNKDVLNTYSLLASYYLDAQTMVYTEFGRSDVDKYNGGLGLGVAHRMDNKNSYSVNYFKQGKYSGLFRNWGAPDFACNVPNSNTSWNGYAVYYRHKMNDKTLVEVSDYYEQGNVNNTANQFRITLMANF